MSVREHWPPSWGLPSRNGKRHWGWCTLWRASMKDSWLGCASARIKVVVGCKEILHVMVVVQYIRLQSRSQSIFPHTEGKNSLVNGQFHFRFLWFKNWWCNVFKNVLGDIMQSLKLWWSCKETACCRDDLSGSFQTPKIKDSQKLETSVNFRETLW